MINQHKRANKYIEENKIDQAILTLRKIVQNYPRYKDIHLVYNQLGILLTLEGKSEQGLRFFNKAIKQDDKYQEAYYNIGVFYAQRDEFDTAIRYYKKAIEISPDYGAAYLDIAAILGKQGKPTLAIPYFKKGLLDEKVSYQSYSSMLFALNNTLEYGQEEVFKEYTDFYNKFAKPLEENRPPYENDFDSQRKIKVGYVSGDFRSHPVAFFILPALLQYSKDQFEIYAYSSVEPKMYTSTTDQIKSLVDVFRDISSMDDEELAALIREDQIDILVDLSGHTAHNRLLTFARKPAPVQVTWIGYPNTTGLKPIDYRITDYYADPVGLNDAYYTEQLIRMPNSFLCYTNADSVPEVGDLAYEKTKRISFVSCNNFAKVTDEIIKAWGAILERVPNSTLVLKARLLADEEFVEEVKIRFEKLGLDSKKVEFLGQDKASTDHWNRYNTVDIALDTHPYNGATTTCEALIMGVPVITLAGKPHVSRVGASLLSNIGLADLVAHTLEEYIDKAVSLAGDIERLTYLKKNLRPMMKASPLMNQREFTQDLEQLYKDMWYQCCQEYGDTSSQNNEAIDLANKQILKDLLQGIDGVIDMLNNLSHMIGQDDLSKTLNHAIQMMEDIYLLEQDLENIFPQEEIIIEINNKMTQSLNLLQKSYQGNDKESIIKIIEEMLLPVSLTLQELITNQITLLS